MELLKLKTPINRDNIKRIFNKRIKVKNNTIILKEKSYDFYNKDYNASCKKANKKLLPKKVNGNVNLSYSSLNSLKGIGQKYLREINGELDLTGIELKENILGLLLIKNVRKIKLSNKKIQQIINKHLKFVKRALSKSEPITPVITKCKIELNNNGFKKLARF